MIYRVESKNTPTPVNHIFVVDVSGSMSETLPKLRNDLKNKIASLVTIGDTITIIYFSGRDAAGYVFRNKSVASVSDLTQIHEAIDKWLTPMGLTAFCKPLSLAIDATNNDMLNSMVFITDGYNNDCQTEAVMLMLDKVKNAFASVYFIEYGYHCDSNLISIMAERTGGTVLNAVGFNELMSVVEQCIGSTVLPKISVEVNGDWLVAYANKSLVLYKDNNEHQVLIPGNSEWYCTGITDESSKLELLVCAWAYFTIGDALQCERALCHLGDVGLIQAFNNAYGKQKSVEFKQMILDTIRGDRTLYVDGEDYTFKPNPSAYTVMDLLSDLSSSDDNLIYINHPEFEYNRISAMRVNAASGAIDEAAQFIPNDKNAGVPFTTLTYNSSRANINFTVTIPGKVVNIPTNKWDIVEYPSQITRTYNVIKDGVLNITRFPVSLNQATFEKFNTMGLIASRIDDVDGRGVFIVDFSKLPVINRSMLHDMLHSEVAARLYLDLLEEQAAAKVFKYFVKRDDEPDTSDEQSVFLSEVGIKPYGFNPPTVRSELTDFYYAPELKAKISGASALPSIASVETKLDAGKSLNLADKMIAKYIKFYKESIDLVNKHLISEEIINETMPTAAINRKRKTEYEVAKLVMSIILGRQWFVDKQDYDDNTTTIHHSEWGDVVVKFEYKDVEVRI